MKFRAALIIFVAFLCVGTARSQDTSNVIVGNEAVLHGKIAITIDDCINEPNTRAMLDLLIANNLTATFFPNLDYITDDDPQLWKDIISSGMDIGYHTTDHAAGRTIQELEADFREFEDGVRTLLGDETFTIKVVRPPYGDWNEWWLSWAQTNNLYTVRWNFVPSSKVGMSYFQTIKDRDDGGSIILLHPRDWDLNWITNNIQALIELVGGTGNSDLFPTIRAAYGL